MILFLTSSPSGPLDGSRKVEGLDKMNHFTDNLKKYWREDSRCLMICAAPDSYEMNDGMADFFRGAVETAGFTVGAFGLWDARTTGMSKEVLHSYDVIFLGGGHVPTQNAFFHSIRLREMIQDFDGIVVGISAGTMNSADTVYAQPELPGEAEDPSYERSLSGLGLTKTMILPHYQMVKDNVLDGKRLYEDITFGDSFGKKFLVLPDGSYLLAEDGVETVWGEAYQISDGEITRICGEDETLVWTAD